jgi:DNA-binding CsgD family transcriptional regulator
MGETAFPAWAIALSGVGSVLIASAVTVVILRLRKLKVASAVTYERTAEGKTEKSVADGYDRAEGEIDISSIIKENLDRLALECGLTAREKEIAAYIIEGKTRPEIANVLFISEGTVKTHTQNLYKKLNVGSKLELLTKLQNL